MICPKCKLECEGEAIRDKAPYFLNCECECGFEFCYDSYREEYFTIDGDLIKGEPTYKPENDPNFNGEQ